MIPEYRVWDKKTNRVAEVVAIVFSPFSIEDDCDSKLGDAVIYDGVWINTDKDCLFEEHREFNQVELMQYTGLKDCKDTEIYEGDIVKFSGTEGDTAMAVVEFYNGRFIFRLNKNAYKDISGWKRVKVVGNKYTHQGMMPK